MPVRPIISMAKGEIRLDEKDREIISELISNSRQTAGQLSKKIGLPPTTIHNRIKKIEKHGVILNYSANVDYKKIGRPILAYIGITINYNIEGKKIKQREVAEKIRKLQGVNEVTVLTGGLDIIAKIIAADIDELNKIVTEKLREIDGVDKTQTMIALQQV